MNKIQFDYILHDDAGNREKFRVMSKAEVMYDDSRNEDSQFLGQIEEFLQFGKTYRVTFEEVPTLPAQNP